MPRFDRTIRVSILWDRGHHRHKNDIINNNSITNGMLNPRRDTRWFLVDRRKTKWNIFHPCVPVIDFDEGRAGWELMIANRGLHRSQPIWITLHRSTVPLRIVHDRFSCSASLSLSLSLSLPLSPSIPLFIPSWSIWHSFTTDSTLVRTLLRCLEANIAEAIGYTRGVNRGPATFGFGW